MKVFGSQSLAVFIGLLLGCATNAKAQVLQNASKPVKTSPQTGVDEGAKPYAPYSPYSPYSPSYYGEVKLGLLALGVEFGFQRPQQQEAFFYLAEIEGFFLVGSWQQHLIGHKYFFAGKWFWRSALGLQVDKAWNREGRYDPVVSGLLGYEWSQGHWRLGWDVAGLALRADRSDGLAVLPHLPKFKLGYNF